MYMVL